ncbi:hypothetical protein AKO1_003705 [Acrasis kona]|uniref:Uncharacterized protein n=1 Tax=Acrasis kona TaxID=1008807 RepID=A0AAW2Z4M6_9EUKA
MQSSLLRRLQTVIRHVNPNHDERVATAAAFRTIHTGIEYDPDAASFDRRKPLSLELRRSQWNSTDVPTDGDSEQSKGAPSSYPHTTILLLDHIFHVSRLLNARHIHLKYVEASTDTYVMFRTQYGLITYSTINNGHWIHYLMMHATGQEEPEKAGEGEFRLEVINERDGRMEFTVNIVYIQGGVKLTISPLN